MNFKFKNIISSVIAGILIATILTLNLPLLINYSCSSMQTEDCSCKKTIAKKSCCEKDSQAGPIFNPASHCKCYISDAAANATPYENQTTIGNKLSISEKIFYTLNFTEHDNRSYKFETNIHSPPLIANSPVYISIHSLLI